MIAECLATFNGVDTRMLSVPGDGAAVVLLHGYADSADTWRAVLACLGEQGRRAVAVDLPGFGRAGPRDPGPLLPQFDAFVDSLLEETGPALLVGNSLGAATAVRAADRRPQLVRGLVAIDDPVNARHWLARLARYGDIPSRVWQEVARVPVPSRVLQWVAARALRQVLYGPGATSDPEVLAYWTQLLASGSELAHLGRYALQYARETTAGHHGVCVSCPTVVVHGAKDRIIPVHASRRLHQQIPGSQLVILPRSGHCPQLDDPETVARLVVGLEGVR